MSTTTLPRRRKLDVEAYHRMTEVGIFAPDERVELIDGEIVEMVPIGSEHAAAVVRLNRLFDPAHLQGRATVGRSEPAAPGRGQRARPGRDAASPAR